MRRKWHRAAPKDNKPKFKSNGQIKSPEVFLIDQDGEQKGKIPTEKAIEMAKEFDLDLVEINPKSEPPVAKILDLGQLKYEQDKKAHKQKMQQKKIDTKVIRLSMRIGKHDLGIRFEQAKKFLEKSNKIKIELTLKGLERKYPEKGVQVIKDFVQKLEQIEEFNIIKEQDLTKQGKRFSIVLVNKNN